MSASSLADPRPRDPRQRTYAKAVRSEGMLTAQCERILDAAVRCSYEEGVLRVTVGKVTTRAGVSRKTFYDLFADRQDCLGAAFEQAVLAAKKRAAPAYAQDPSWAGATRAGLAALLTYFHEHPDLARLCLLDAVCAGPRALAYRAHVLEELARMVDRGRPLARREPCPLTAEAVVGGVLELLRTHLQQQDAPPLTELLNPLMSFVVLPYLGGTVARREAVHPDVPVPGPVRDAPLPHPLEGLKIRLTYRTIRALAAIGDTPGVSNADFSRLVGIVDQGQASKLLARLRRLGLAENTGGGQSRGEANAWSLTERGRSLDNHLKRMSLSRQ